MDLERLRYAYGHVTWAELSCRGRLWIPTTEEEERFFWSTLDLLSRLEERAGVRLMVTSAHRTYMRNLMVGGALRSLHLQLALDLVPDPEAPIPDLARLAEEVGYSGIGTYATHLHVDCRALLGRPLARWSG